MKIATQAKKTSHSGNNTFYSEFTTRTTASSRIIHNFFCFNYNDFETNQLIFARSNVTVKQEDNMNATFGSCRG